MKTSEAEFLKNLSARSYHSIADSERRNFPANTVDAAYISIKDDDGSYTRVPQMPFGIIRDKAAGGDLSTNKRRKRSSQSKGRPQNGASGSAILSEKRRTQVRQAQNRYRLKKEVKLQSLQRHVDDLAQRLDETSRNFADLEQVALKYNIKETHPELFACLDKMRLPINGIQTDVITATDRENHRDTPDWYHLGDSSSPHDFMDPLEMIDSDEIEDSEPRIHVEADIKSSYVYSGEAIYTSRHAWRPKVKNNKPQRIQRPINSNSSYTLCFQEPDFTRRLHRYCLEYAFQIFADTTTSPMDFYRVFRLVPCIRDRSNMYPHFRRLVLRGRNREPLEIPKLPLYCIGGAGTHYPQRDEKGNPIYPSKMRLPGRILGIMPESNEIFSKRTRLRNLALFGYDGEWFDCNDVAGYLEEIGVDLRSDQLFATIDCANERMPAFIDVSINRDLQEIDIHPSPCDDTTQYVLDVESFFTTLLQGVVLLGRAPGFRKSDVDIAFKSSLRMRHVK
ncbi:hypothetical protein BGW36DRAFT_457934 [Talaromyces proteolyticus]|uniref:BZIP domain-containing protein n=1 Tax=Talaromyces proteolyticus TaxID=1131652 RepID=A0AAD4KY64_9EURO|nr:uncharacterized protein BGW36DRAFT_457934 [Talaromyces proteolyticus]KAH8703720.1 hypothetical protein BGW36DRAFT_457934 [Talaromyces proteolyticus]